jgi:glycosyltransferase involved in cell wall biosynthesis
MRQARAFVQHSVQTSYGDSEGTPVGILEGGAAGLPVVATRHAGIQDVIIDGETGLLVDEGDVDSMAESMIRLGENPVLAAELGKAARKRICAEFSMEKSIDNLWGIIETTIHK